MSAALPLGLLSFPLGQAGKGVLIICIVSTRADSSRLRDPKAVAGCSSPRCYAVAQIVCLFWAESFRDKQVQVWQPEEGQVT